MKKEKTMSKKQKLERLRRKARKVIDELMLLYANISLFSEDKDDRYNCFIETQSFSNKKYGTHYVTMSLTAIKAKN